MLTLAPMLGPNTTPRAEPILPVVCTSSRLPFLVLNRPPRLLPRRMLGRQDRRMAPLQRLWMRVQIPTNNSNSNSLEGLGRPSRPRQVVSRVSSPVRTSSDIHRTPPRRPALRMSPRLTVHGRPVLHRLRAKCIARPSPRTSLVYTLSTNSTSHSSTAENQISLGECAR